MTKKEKHQAINREFFKSVENLFHIDDDGDGGRVTLSIADKAIEDKMVEDGSYYSDHYIEYHLSRHTVVCYNGANDYIKAQVKWMEDTIDALIAKYEL